MQCVNDEVEVTQHNSLINIEIQKVVCDEPLTSKMFNESQMELPESNQSKKESSKKATESIVMIENQIIKKKRKTDLNSNRQMTDLSDLAKS